MGPPLRNNNAKGDPPSRPYKTPPPSRLDKRARRLRPSEHIPLQFIARSVFQKAVLILGFDPFGQHIHAQFLAEPDDRADDFDVVVDRFAL